MKSDASRGRQGAPLWFTNVCTKAALAVRTAHYPYLVVAREAGGHRTNIYVRVASDHLGLECRGSVGIDIGAELDGVSNCRDRCGSGQDLDTHRGSARLGDADTAGRGIGEIDHSA